MNLPFRWCWALTWTRAALLLAASLALLPAEARAGCTHPWVASPAASPSRLDDLDLLASGGESIHPDRPNPQPRPEEPSPCAGGRCRPAQDVPSGAMTPPEARRDTQGFLTAPAPREGSASTPVVPAHVPLRPIRLSDPLDRPPRAGI